MGDRASSAMPRELSVLEPDHTGGSAVSGLACGGGHSLVLLEDGRVMAFGRGRNGQLGSGR